jgi:hypothetical protein
VYIIDILNYGSKIYSSGHIRWKSTDVKVFKTMAKTSKKAGKAASKVLRSGSTGKNSKTAAASALRQRQDRK